ncbi:hypothetical protein [Archaeoglobus sp.]
MNRWILIALSFLLALALSIIHWAGIIIGGLIAGYFSRNFKEALAVGFAMGFFIYGAFMAYLAYMGMLEKFLALSPLSYISLVLCLVLAVISTIITNFFSPYAVKNL